MRDTRKDEAYFQKKLQSEQARIARFEAALENTPPSNERGVRIGKGQLANLYLNCTKLSYSMGASLEEVYACYIRFLDYYKDVCTPADSTYTVIDALAVGVLFERSKQEFLPALRKIVNQFDLQDGLIQCLLHYLEGEALDTGPSQLEYYNQLVESNDKLNILLDELSQWYQHHRDAHWYNSHQSKNNTYCGYWCFEIAALAKVFGIDDTELARSPYYPTDLAHFA